MKKFNNLLIIVVIVFSLFFLIVNFSSLSISKILSMISIFFVLFLPKILHCLFRLEISEELQCFFSLFVFLAMFLGTGLGFYHKVLGYDKILHFTSGFLMCGFGICVFKKISIVRNLKFLLLFLFLFALSCSVLWEFFEFFADSIFHSDTQRVIETGVSDTMIDMLLSSCSACLFILIYGVKNKKILRKR